MKNSLEVCCVVLIIVGWLVTILGLTGQFEPSPIVFDIKQIMINRPLMKIITQSLINNILDGGILGWISSWMFIPDQDFTRYAGFDLQIGKGITLFGPTGNVFVVCVDTVIHELFWRICWMAIWP